MNITREALEHYLRAIRSPSLPNVSEMLDDGCTVQDVVPPPAVRQ